ncbi:ABC transporter ATP-binding protein [Isoptericola sp. b408]|uniref:ATP-binding cassette domain-containing protein n=1 Tax=Isoptericola sp. b408 TaxID=3064653 RepID=UPI0027129D48|nr:ABC transporter ATP-binding protein [Isoptericola sp. b408]MDO8150749.1 ABC transporter ATP-binding protein [Isoptericola sp. b408]
MIELSAPPARPTTVAQDPARRLDWRRLRGPVSAVALGALAVGTVGTALGTVVAGGLAEDPTTTGVLLLALCLMGGALLDAAGQVAWAGVVDRAEGRLRRDLLTAALHQPLGVLTEQAVGEILDRVDDDTHSVGGLARRQLWGMGRTVVGVGPIWVVATLTWWPAGVLFPLLGAVTWWTVRPLLGEIARRKVVEERAWTDQAAVLEEGVAARDDLRTAGGQGFALRRLAEMSARVHRALLAVVRVEIRLMARAGVLLHALLAGVVVAGVALAVTGSMPVDRLVTLFLATSLFVGQVDRLAQHLPDLQEGLGAVVRIRQLLDSEPEPVGGATLPDRPLDIEVRGLRFAYDEGTFALRDVSLSVAAGQTVAFVGRTGSGKTTLASLLSRAVEPPPGTVFLGGVDVRDADLQHLRGAVGVVTQRTEILAGTLEQNITLFADLPRADVEAAVHELGLDDWVAGLPDGLDTLLGPGGTSLSAGEEQLVAFARLLVRDVRLVVLDEATARMDPHTEERVVAASHRLLAGRTGVVVAHRLGTVRRAHRVVVLDHGRVVQQGLRADLVRQEGPFRDLLAAGGGTGDDVLIDGDPGEPVPHAGDDVPSADRSAGATSGSVGGRRRVGEPPTLAEPGRGPGLARSVLHALVTRPRWGLAATGLFLLSVLFAAQGALAGFLWGRAVETVAAGGTPVAQTAGLVAMLLAAPLCLAAAVRLYPSWWIEIMLRVRVAVLVGQTRRHRLRRSPAGEVVARALDADRFVLYVDRWVDFLNGLVVVLVTWAVSREPLAGLVLLAVMVTTAACALAGRPVAGRTATRSAEARAGFGRALVSALDAARTVKLAARTPQVHRHLDQVDAGRVGAAIREHRVQAVLDGIPTVMVQAGVVTAWMLLLTGTWDLATTLLVTAAVSGFQYFGVVAGAVITEAPGTRAWLRATQAFAGGADLTRLPEGVDLFDGTAPSPVPASPPTAPFDRLELSGLEAVHDDGTIGVTGVDLQVERGELVLLLGQVGSGKSSLLSAAAGLMAHRGDVRWNGEVVTDAETFLRPARVAHVAQVPRVLSGTFAENVTLDHARDVVGPVDVARLAPDVADAGGADAVVGHRGVRLSGGQVQRLALARALATGSEVLLADDVSSALDAATEVELWAALRAQGLTVIGSTSKRAALARADRVVVLVEGRVAEVGPWSALERRWGHLAG